MVARPPPTSPTLPRPATAVVIGLLATPLLLTLALGPTHLDENRAPVRFPPLPRSTTELALYPPRFEIAFDRAFQPRPLLVRAYSRAVVLGLGGAALRAQAEVPTRTVIVGEDGELFHGEGAAVELHRAVPRVGRAEEVQRWARHLAARQASFVARGARYVVVVAPDKQTLYDEALPRWARRVGRPLLDDLLEAAANVGVDVVDLRPALHEAKRHARVYHRTDTHWNDVGACVAAVALRRSLALPSEPNDAQLCLSPLATRRRSGDLAMMLGLEEALAELEPVPSRAARASREGDVFVGAGRGRAWLLGDSFRAALAPFVAPSFQELREAPREAIAAPDVSAGDVVIEEIVERAFAAPP